MQRFPVHAPSRLQPGLSKRRTKAPSAALAAALFLLGGIPAHSQQASLARGKYLVTLGGCNDCHTPGYFFGKLDPARTLGGSDVGFALPGLGTFVAPNLTPDKETGLGNWSRDDIVTAIQTGVTPDGRVLAPIMPWRSFSQLTKSDAFAIADYLRSLPPVEHKVPGPFGPAEKPAIFVMQLLAPPAAGQPAQQK